MTYLVPFLSTLIISFLLTAVFRRLGVKYGIVSHPTTRDIHKSPIPRIGGLAIMLSFVTVAIFIFVVFSSQYNFSGQKFLGLDKTFLAIIAGGVIISLAMLLDDIYRLKAWQKLLIQIFVSLIVVILGVGIDSLTNPSGGFWNLNTFTFNVGGFSHTFSLWADLLTIVWLVLMMNVINFVDGVDGLAGGLSAISAIVVFLLSISQAVNQPSTAMLSIVLLGAVLGFLIWNFPPAKIFMGDSGSMFLGFMIGILPLISGGKLATIFLVLGFPIVDTFFVAINRLTKGKNPFTTPDKTHLHHRFLNAGFSQRQSIFSLYVVSAVFGWVALQASTAQKIIAALVMVLSLFLLVFFLDIIAKKRLAKTR